MGRGKSQKGKQAQRVKRQRQKTKAIKKTAKKQIDKKLIKSLKQKVGRPKIQSPKKQQKKPKNTLGNKNDKISQNKNDQVNEINFEYSRESGQISKEKGFTGGPKNWFDDKEFNKSMCADLKQHNHDYYFGSYSNFYIHDEMLKDTIRTEAYKKAFELNASYFKDKVVMDIGTGTGILSLFAAKAGAKKVHAVENAEIANFAKQIIQTNGYENVITVHKCKLEDLKLNEKVDIIVSEWMGYFLLYEGMLDTVLLARDKFLKKNGRLFPNRGIMHIAAIEDEKFKRSKVEFWKNVYGFDMSCMAATFLSEPIIDILESTHIISNSAQIVDFDFDKMNKEDVQFSTSYSLQFNKTEKCNGIVAWFDTVFSNMEHPVTLSTSPYKRPTHWK